MLSSTNTGGGIYVSRFYNWKARLDDLFRESVKNNALIGPALGAMIDSTSHRDQLLRASATYK
jgi:hypothetical protein